MTEPRYERLPPRVPGQEALKTSMGVLGGGPSTAPVSPATVATSLSRNFRGAAVTAQCPPGRTDIGNCSLPIWVTFFFDGTGNNRKTDSPTFEHSNVVRMFNAHQRFDPTECMFPFYLPGIGTPFPEIGDNGYGVYEDFNINAGAGARGQARIDHAFERLQSAVTALPSRHTSNIYVSVFGFSRGAALARAFLYQLANGQHCLQVGGKLTWKAGGIPLEVKFVGLWDTVASVGLPMAASSIASVRNERRKKSTSWGRDLVQNWLSVARFLPGPLEKVEGEAAHQLGNGKSLSVLDLAFSDGPTDPAPGSFNGHASWGGQMALDGSLYAKCVHMIAGHEVRNSFPVDSALRARVRPINTVEMVFPGVHSDVGGGYRPGEGGMGTAAGSGQMNVEADALKLSQIPLIAMYKEALVAGVPLRAMGDSSQWRSEQKADFKLNAGLADLYNHYMSTAATGGLPLGDAMLRHMRLYYGWRFQHIRRGLASASSAKPEGRAADKARIEANEKVFAQDSIAAQARVNVVLGRKAQLEDEREALQKEVDLLQAQANNTAYSGLSRMWQDPRMVGMDPRSLPRQPTQGDVLAKQRQIQAAEEKIRQTEIELYDAKATLATLPSQGVLVGALNRFDAELIEDAHTLHVAVTRFPQKRALMRPHYRNLLAAFEDEFVNNKGMRDPKLIAFFENHVHDSLASFDKDATLPSDPRVVYVGGDEKA